MHGKQSCVYRRRSTGFGVPVIADNTSVRGQGPTDPVQPLPAMSSRSVLAAWFRRVSQYTPSTL